MRTGSRGHGLPPRLTVLTQEAIDNVHWARDDTPAIRMQACQKGRETLASERSEEGCLPLALKCRRLLRPVTSRVPVDVIPHRATEATRSFPREIELGEVVYVDRGAPLARRFGLDERFLRHHRAREGCERSARHWVRGITLARRK